MSGEWVPCSINHGEFSGVRIGGRVFSTAADEMTIDSGSVRVQVAPGRCMTIAYDDFKLFGIEPVKFVKSEPMETEVWLGSKSTCTEVLGRKVFTAVICLPEEWSRCNKVKVIEVLE